jgi:hypothetical protein
MFFFFFFFFTQLGLRKFHICEIVVVQESNFTKLWLCKHHICLFGKLSFFFYKSHFFAHKVWILRFSFTGTGGSPGAAVAVRLSVSLETLLGMHVSQVKCLL